MEDYQSVDEISISISISIVWRGKKFDVQMSPKATLKELGDQMQKLTNVRADTMRFIVPQSNKGSKLLTPFSNEHERLSLQETTIIEGKPIRMMGVSENEVDEILQGEKLNLRIAGFDEEENRLRKRMSNGFQFSRKLPQGPYTFADFRTLQLPGIELNPPASEALKRMHMLASDPGIVSIMNKHRWRVGIMTEMAPVGYVGVSPKCILGFNMNQGEEISLRLRTDDLKGFRKYERIKETLIHELAHMVYTEHDANFFALNSQLREEAISLDWTRSRSHTVSGIRRSEFDEGDFFVEESNVTSQKLGGNKNPDQISSARMASVAAAYRRMLDAPPTINSPEDCEVSEDEPDPDASEFLAQEGTSHNDHSVKEKLDDDDESFDEIDQKHYEEPDPDDASESLNEFEPDPDASQEEKTINEPDPDEFGFEAERDVLGPIEEETLTGGKVDDRTRLEMGYERSELGGPREEDGTIQAMQIDDEELQRIRDPVAEACGRLKKAIELLRAEVGPAQAVVVLQTIFKIISNVIEHPNEMKFKKLRKANPVIQRTIANYKAAIELLVLIGFNEELVSDEMGKAETYLVLKRNDPGFLWLAKSCIETAFVP